MNTESQPLHAWLRLYGNNHHAWKMENDCTFKRRVGLVENSFHADGVYYRGRADMHSTLTVEIRSTIREDKIYKRIAQAWTILRLRHPLLLATIRGDSHLGQETYYIVTVPKDPTEALNDAGSTVTSLDSHVDIDTQEFIKHVLNTGRIIDHTKYLSQLFVLPIQQLPNGHFKLQIVQITAHTISDGLSMVNWTSDFVDLVNQSQDQLETSLEEALDMRTIAKRLPPAQENLYPPIPGNRARQRWFWAIVRVLRHVRKSLPQGFPNPLRREEHTSVVLKEKYREVLNYSPNSRPPLSSGHSTLYLSPSAFQRLIKLCREANTTIGAGCFALTGLIMMELEEQRHPNIPLRERAPFVGSFPLNPRPFFKYASHDSCMLAFSDGIVLPFLPSDTSLERRFRLLAISAHRQLRSYQKKPRSAEETLDSHSPLRMLASNYLLAIERQEAKLPEQCRTGINPQGSLPANHSFLSATCGVSSTGSLKQWVTPGKYTLDKNPKKDLVADFRSVIMGVRARENEFLVGNSSYGDGFLHFGVSYDASVLDEELVELWKEKMETVFEEKTDVARSAL